MTFAEVAMDDGAVGAVLAHTHRLADRVLAKGRRLDADMVAALRAAGRARAFVARLEPGDVAEDVAAERLGAALLAPNLRAGRAGTGRVNLHATVAGLLRVDARTIDAVNAVHPALTVATLPAEAVVSAGEMLATIKVIPFAVPGDALVRAEAAAAGAIVLDPFRPLRAALVLTTTPGLKPALLDAVVAATRERMVAVGGWLLPEVARTPHETEAIAATLLAVRRDHAPDLLLVAAASATVDFRDAGPAGIVAAGGTVERFGMPVDPGNLLCLGTLGGRPVVVLPGCARSPVANGIDLVLRRLAAGVPVGSAEIGRMGVGGLLKEPPSRPVRRAAASTTSPPVAAIVLAAGQSSRMAPRHKLLVEDAEGRAMVARVVDAALGSRARPVVVVLGHRADEVRAALAGRAVEYVTAENHAAGLSASLRAGISALPASVSGALVLLGDMPLVDAATLDALIDAYDPAVGRGIVQPTHDGRGGNPVLWDRQFFPAMQALGGDSGARHLLRRHADAVTEVEMPTDAVLRDFDTAASLLDWTDGGG